MVHFHSFTILLFFTLHYKGIKCENKNDVLSFSREVMTEFYKRYQTKEIDLVFVMDRSASVDRNSWISMVNFVRSLLEHFTVDRDNTRVAIITYSTSATTVINDLDDSAQNKCSLITRIKEMLMNQRLAGYTATHDALQVAVSLFFYSRSTAKKFVFVLTDGRSNIGPPPVRASVDLRSIQWNVDWNTTEYGPQLEVYGIGIQNADMEELKSIGSPLPNHTFYIPNFKMFRELARYLHRDKQAERWSLLSDRSLCGGQCSDNAYCTCGTKSGDYQCVCKEGYQGNGIHCEECPIGYFKSLALPVQCQKCPEDRTTRSKGATHEDNCLLNKCPALPDIENGFKFHVKGEMTSEVPDLGLHCDNTLMNSCHYKCEEGYRLSGHPGLICTSNGTWSGQIPVCKVVNCKSLEYHGQEADNSNVIYINGTTTYGSLLQVTCHTGWRLYGSEVRACTEHGVWNGTQSWCIEVKCPALPLISLGQISPHSCSQTVHGVNMTCRYRCQSGYKVQGPETKTCHPSGQWSPSESNFCKDIMPPSITCPSNITVYITEGNYTIIDWDIERPKVEDNSRKFKIRVNGWRKSPIKFLIGYHKIEYTAEDDAGNQATCTRSISVIDKVIRMVSCPDDIVMNDVITSEMGVSWADPVFMDMDNRTVHYQCTRQSGSVFSVGSHNVVCNPAENGTSVYCSFKITLKRKKCFVPPAPLHGSLSCFNSSSFLQQCSVMCNNGYDFYNFPQTFYKCDLNGNWMLRNNQFWPDCSLIHYPGMAVMEGADFKYSYYGGNCSDIKSKIAEVFREKVQNYAWDICGDKTCNVTGVKVKCGLRSKRSGIQNDHAISRWKREIQNGSGFNTSNLQQIKNVSHNLSDKDNGTNIEMDNKSDSLQIQTIKISLDIEVQNTDSNSPVTYLKYRRMKVLLGTLVASRNITVGIDEGHTIEMVQTEYNMKQLQLSYSDCVKGFIRKTQRSFVTCVGCPPGSYSFNNSCQACPVGTFQSKEGMTQCMPCPEGTTTSEIGTKDVKECKKLCPVGHYSSTTLDPCVPCDIGYFQDQLGQKSCIRCPGNTSTIYHEASKLTDCREKCIPGTYSPFGGLQPCLPCPVGTYQPLGGAVLCISCPDDLLTPNEGATLHNQCAGTDYCHNETYSPCQNNGVCRSLTNGYVCDCPSDVTGSHCESPVDHCASSPCNNNGTCTSSSSGFKCLCSSNYSGKTCATLVKYCDNNPCLYGGSCVDKEKGYKCICRFGYSGSNCEIYNSCTTYPCRHGDCINLNNGYKCNCHLGYTGHTCNAVDMCVFKPCLNNGTCRMLDEDIFCSCTAGYTGERCETLEATACSDQICNNHGECTQTAYGINCRCLTGYGGTLCDTEMTPDFDLVFKSASNKDYVLLPLDVHNLTEITVCMWLRTTDRVNYGTPFSYLVQQSTDSILQGNTCIFTLYDYGRFQVIVNGETIITDITVNDGNWHHVCLVWESSGGSWSMYVNGTLREKGDNFGKGVILPGNGTLVVGQEQLSTGNTFNSRESFIGELSQFNIFDKVLSPGEIKILGNTNKCNMTSGTLVAWIDMIGKLSGNVVLQEGSQCLDSQHNSLLNPCTSNPCMQNMTCVQTSDTYKCLCTEDKKTAQCIITNNQCSPNPCKNNGVCNIVNGRRTCICRTGYGGDLCDEGSEKCRNNPCENDGECIETATSKTSKYYCNCPPNLKGRHCTLPFHPTCKSIPCLNNGTCMESPNSNLQYKCECPITDSLTGQSCEVDPCLKRPCKNSGVCVRNTSASYHCLCQDPFVGTNCEVNTNTKSVSTESVTVVLKPRFRKRKRGRKVNRVTNTTTESMTTNKQDLQLCDSKKCQNGGICGLNEKGLPSCICPVQFFGDGCEFERSLETALYNVSLVLKVQYVSVLTNRRMFRRRFARQIVRLYNTVIAENMIRPQNVSFRPTYDGETFVTFLLRYTFFVDSPSLLSKSDVKVTLQQQISTGYLGILLVDPDVFRFQSVRVTSSLNTQNDDNQGNPYMLTIYLVTTLIVLLAIILGFILFIVFRIRRLAYRKRHGLLRGHDLSLNNNPAFDPSMTLERMSDRHPSGEENMYAELSELVDPYYVTCKSDMKDGFSSRCSSRFSSSRSHKDCNVDMATTRKISDISLTHSLKVQTSKKKLNSSSDSDSEHHYFSPVFNKNEFCYPLSNKDTKELLPSSGKSAKLNNLDRGVHLNSTSSDGSQTLKTPTYTEAYSQRELEFSRKGNDSTETLPFLAYENSLSDIQHTLENGMNEDDIPTSLLKSIEEQDDGYGITLQFPNTSVFKQSCSSETDLPPSYREATRSLNEPCYSNHSNYITNNSNQNHCDNLQRMAAEQSLVNGDILEEASMLDNVYVLASTTVEHPVLFDCKHTAAIVIDNVEVLGNTETKHQGHNNVKTFSKQDESNCKEMSGENTVSDTESLEFCYTVPKYIENRDKMDKETTKVRLYTKKTKPKPRAEEGLYITPENQRHRKNRGIWKSSPDLTSTSDDYALPDMRMELGSTESFMKLLQRTKAFNQDYMDMSGLQDKSLERSSDVKYDSDSLVLSNTQRKSIKLKKKRSKSMHDYLEILPAQNSEQFTTLPRAGYRKDIANRKLPPLPKDAKLK